MRSFGFRSYRHLVSSVPGAVAMLIGWTADLPARAAQQPNPDALRWVEVEVRQAGDGRAETPLPAESAQHMVRHGGNPISRITLAPAWRPETRDGVARFAWDPSANPEGVTLLLGRVVLENGMCVTFDLDTSRVDASNPGRAAFPLPAPGSSCTVAVADESGAAVEGFPVALVGQVVVAPGTLFPSVYWCVYGHTDASGRWVPPQLPPGEYGVAPGAPEWASARSMTNEDRCAFGDYGRDREPRHPQGLVPSELGAIRTESPSGQVSGFQVITVDMPHPLIDTRDGTRPGEQVCRITVRRLKRVRLHLDPPDPAALPDSLVSKASPWSMSVEDAGDPRTSWRRVYRDVPLSTSQRWHEPHLETFLPPHGGTLTLETRVGSGSVIMRHVVAAETIAAEEPVPIELPFRPGELRMARLRTIHVEADSSSSGNPPEAWDVLLEGALWGTWRVFIAECIPRGTEGVVVTESMGVRLQVGANRMDFDVPAIRYSVVAMEIPRGQRYFGLGRTCDVDPTEVELLPAEHREIRLRIGGGRP